MNVSAGRELSEDEEEDSVPRPTNRHSSGKRTATPGEEGSSSQQGDSSGEKRQNRSAYDLPESVPAYVLQFTTDSILASMSKTIGNQGYQVGEASLKLHRVEGELEKQRQLVIIEMAKTAAAEREVVELRRVADEALLKARQFEESKVVVLYTFDLSFYLTVFVFSYQGLWVIC